MILILSLIFLKNKIIFNVMVKTQKYGALALDFDLTFLRSSKIVAFYRI